MKSVYKINIFLTVIFFSFILSGFIQAQGVKKSDVIENMVEKLQQKVLLSDQQTSQIKIILVDYSQGMNNDSRISADKKIEALLDTKQKAKYSIIKNDWWGELADHLSRTNS